MMMWSEVVVEAVEDVDSWKDDVSPRRALVSIWIWFGKKRGGEEQKESSQGSAD